MIGVSTAVVGRRIMPTGFEVDLTDPASLDGITTSRTGGDVYAETGLATAAKYSDTDAPIYRKLGDLCPADGLAWPGGVWVGPGWTNRVSEVADPFTYTTGAGWILGTGTYTTGRTAPDGTSTATKIADTSGATYQGVYDVVGTDTRSTVWAMYDSAPASGAEACFIFANDLEYKLAAPSPFASAWRRYHKMQGSISVSGIVGSSVLDGSKQGAAVFWAKQDVIVSPLFNFNLPFGVGTIGHCVGAMPAECVAAAIKNGRLDFEVDMRWCADRADKLNAAAVYLWSLSTPDGECSLRRTTSETLVLKVRGADVLTVTKVLSQQTGGSDGMPVKTRAVYDPGAGTSGVYQNANGCYSQVTSTATGSALAAATAGHFGSLSGTSLFFPAIITGYRTHKSVRALAPEGLLIGDSLVASSGLVASYGSYIYTQAEAASRSGIFLIAHGSATIASQKASFLASPYAGSSGVKWIVVQVGINDIQAGGAEEDVILDLADLVETIRDESHGDTKIILVALTPMPDPYKTIRANVNAEIMDEGGIIQGADARLDSYLDEAETAGSYTSATGTEDWGYGGVDVHSGPLTKRSEGAMLRAYLQGAGLL